MTSESLSHRLHSSGCFVMPNPWDVGSARALEQMGFRALATTSAGFAWTLEGGYTVDPEQVGAHVKRAAATGIGGLSIEDSTGDEADPLFSFELAVERVPAARTASVVEAAASDGRSVLIGRPMARSRGRTVQTKAGPPRGARRDEGP